MTAPDPQTRPEPHPEPEGPPADEDSLDELPPLDGEGGEEVEAPAEDLDDDEVAEAGTGDPFDDATGEGDAVPELEVGGEEGGWLLDAADAETLDVGPAALLGVEDEEAEVKDLLADNDEPGVGDEDFGVDADPVASVMDAGEEGPEGADEALREEDLPRLDADEDGEGDDDSFFDPLPAGDRSVPDVQRGLPEVDRLPWSDRAWSRAAARAPLGAVHALACATRGVLAGGAGILRVDLEGASEELAAVGLGGGDVTALYFDGAAIVVATERGGVFVSRDAGGTFAQANGWRERVSAHEAASGLDVALGAGDLWGRTAQGKLLRSADLGATWESADLDGFVLAIAVDDRGALVALVSALGGTEVVRLVQGTLEATRLAGSFPELRPGVEARVAAWGTATAFAAAGGTVHRTLDGHAWSRVEGTRGAAALEFIDGAGTLVAAVAVEGEDRVWLARVGAAGPARAVAGIDADHMEGSIALAWDEAHGVAWVGGAFGLAAFQPPIDS